MEDQFYCPNCFEGSVHFNGVLYVCSDCAHEFESLEGTESYDQENIYKQAYQGLSKLEHPFFKLKLGTLYTVSAEEEDDRYDTTFIPLAFDTNKNRFFALFHVEEMYVKNSEFLTEVLQMSFEEIKKKADLFRTRSNIPLDPLLCSTDKDGTFLCEIGILFYGIKEIV